MTVLRKGLTRMAMRMGIAALFAFVVSTALLRPGPATGASGPPKAIPIRLAAGHTAAAGRYFYVRGNVIGLYPGRSTTLPLTISNPTFSSIEVNSLTVTVGSTDKAGCDGASTQNLQTANYSGPPFVVPSGGQASVGLPLSMPGTVANACQGATFQLAFGGSATQVTS